MLIAQLTDTHIKPKGKLAYHRVDTAAYLRRTLSHLLGLPQQPDLVVITGDLVDEGKVEEYAHLRELLAPLQQPVLFIPGNHDDREVMRTSLAGIHGWHGAGERASVDALPVHGYWQFNLKASEWPLRIIGLDTVVAGESGGELCAERLAWLSDQLRDDRTTPTLILMHHPPFATGIGHMDEIGLTGAAAFGQLVSAHPQIEVILCGHLHRTIRASVGGRACMTAPSTAHTVRLDLDPLARSLFCLEPSGYLLHWTNGKGIVSHHVNAGEYPGPFPFFEESGALIT